MSDIRLLICRIGMMLDYYFNQIEEDMSDDGLMMEITALQLELVQQIPIMSTEDILIGWEVMYGVHYFTYLTAVYKQSPSVYKQLSDVYNLNKGHFDKVLQLLQTQLTSL